MNPPYILLSAARFEVEAILANHRDIFQYFEIGVGIDEAAIRSKRIVPYCRGKKVLFIGSAGIFAESYDLKLFNINKISWLPYELRENHAHYPIKNPAPIELNKTFMPKSNKLDYAEAYCGPHISDSSNNQINCNGTILENIELFTVAKRLAGVCDFSAILGVTNNIGPHSQKEWLDNHKKIAELCQVELKNMILN